MGDLWATEPTYWIDISQAIYVFQRYASKHKQSLICRPHNFHKIRFSVIFYNVWVTVHVFGQFLISTGVGFVPLLYFNDALYTFMVAIYIHSIFKRLKSLLFIMHGRLLIIKDYMYKLTAVDILSSWSGPCHRHKADTNHRKMGYKL